jgi:cytochrome c oxidase assembly protein subunit 15
MSGDGSALPLPALTAIQIAHRIGAVLIGGFLLWLGWRFATTDGTRPLGRMMMAVVALQIVIGITIVLAGLPLWAAVAHNGVAAVLLSLVVVVAHRATRARLRI